MLIKKSFLLLILQVEPGTQKISYIKSLQRSHFFSQRVINDWNALSHTARSAKDLLTFKRLIDIEISNIMYDFDD